GRIRRGKRRIRQCVTNGGCGVNALSALHAQPRRPDKTRQRRIRQCVTNGGCGVNALSAYMRNPVGRIRHVSVASDNASLMADAA
ncbi:hypothetical protein, partial [Escherichia albertii]|uniref:hypothetical protein n=1 Tax=Escherichia albertii TaxID=208962 RepID=UPI0021D4555E